MTFFTLKNLTQWINPNGQGYLNFIGNKPLIVNGTSLPIVTNTFLQILTSPEQSTPKNLTQWGSTGV